jgi:hypothetical protein
MVLLNELQELVHARQLVVPVAITCRQIGESVYVGLSLDPWIGEG